MALPLPPTALAAVAAALVVVLVVAFILRQRAQASAGVLGGAGGGGGGKRKAADTVVLVGPCGSGKTVLLHQVRAVGGRGQRERGLPRGAAGRQVARRVTTAGGATGVPSL